MPREHTRTLPLMVISESTNGQLLPEARVSERYGVSRMTLRRWDADPKIGFPAPIYIRKRRYRSRAELDAFDARMASLSNK
jgi:hypothetical protein